jgi:hypothetical protein
VSLTRHGCQQVLSIQKGIQVHGPTTQVMAASHGQYVTGVE